MVSQISTVVEGVGYRNRAIIPDMTREKPAVSGTCRNFSDNEQGGLLRCLR
jgi:hypothetical protein